MVSTHSKDARKKSVLAVTQSDLSLADLTEHLMYVIKPVL